MKATHLLMTITFVALGCIVGLLAFNAPSIFTKAFGCVTILACSIAAAIRAKAFARNEKDW